MFEFTGLADMKGWMNLPAPDAEPAGSVVISSRVRLARNLAAYAYPGRIPADQENECRERVVGAFRGLPNAEDFTILSLDDLPALDRRILFERNLVSQGYSVEKRRAVALSIDESVVGTIGDEDHLRLAALGCGSCLEPLLARLDALDTALEESLSYAFSPEWGYLNTAITNLGTGLKASMMLHLPALSMSGLIKRAVKASAQLGLSIRGFYSESMDSLGDMYVIANEITIGLAEKEIIGNLGRIAVQLAGYENRTREELLEKRRVDIEDRVLQGVGSSHVVPLHDAPGGHRGAFRAPHGHCTGADHVGGDGDHHRAVVPVAEVAYPAGAPIPGRRGRQQADRLHAGEDHPRCAHANEGRLRLCSRV